MKIQVREKLSKIYSILKKVKMAKSRGTYYTIQDNILVYVKEGKILFAKTNNDSAVICEVNGSASEDGYFFLPESLLKSIHSFEPVDITFGKTPIDEDNKTGGTPYVKVESGPMSETVSVDEVDDVCFGRYSKFFLSPEWITDDDTPDLVNTIVTASAFASKNKSRYALTHIFVTKKNRKILVDSSNGKIAFRRELKAKSKANSFSALCDPSISLYATEVSKQLVYIGVIRVGKGVDNADYIGYKFLKDRFEYWTSCLDGQFPNFDNVIPKRTDGDPLFVIDPAFSKADYIRLKNLVPETTQTYSNRDEGQNVYRLGCVDGDLWFHGFGGSYATIPGQGFANKISLASCYVRLIFGFEKLTANMGEVKSIYIRDHTSPATFNLSNNITIMLMPVNSNDWK